MESALYPGADDPDLKLIETLLWDGARFPRLPLHAARMAQSAEALGWAFDLAAFRKALEARPEAPARVRVTANRAGEVVAAFHPLPPRAQEWRIAVCPVRLRSDDPWLGLKTTRRAVYDRARATMPVGVDELLFANEKGEVCEGTITNIFFDRGKGLRTPPRVSGLLPGVLREAMACPEEVLLFADLPMVRLWVGNALRGLIPTVWA